MLILIKYVLQLLKTKRPVRTIPKKTPKKSRTISNSLNSVRKTSYSITHSGTLKSKT